MAEHKRHPKPARRDEDVVLLKDLVPRNDVRGGGQLRFGEPPSPRAGPRGR